MPRLVFEKNFEPLFLKDDYGTYFYDQILNFGWGYLVYKDDFIATPDLVDEFYRGFDRDNVLNNSELIVVNWRGTTYHVDLNMISEITGIQICEGDQQSQSTEFYLPLMGDACRIPADGGIKNTTVYKNVHITARWLHVNVLGTSHATSFYLQTLHIIHCLMTRNSQFCMCRQLLRTIADTHLRPRTTYPLPILVTLICQRFMGSNAFHEHCSQHPVIQIQTEKLSPAYRACLPTCWTPTHQQEDIPAESSSSSEDEPITADFYDPPHPRNQNAFNSKVMEGMKGLFRKLDIVQKNQERQLEMLQKLSEGSSSGSKRKRR